MPQTYTRTNTITLTQENAGLMIIKYWSVIPLKLRIALELFAAKEANNLL